MNGRTKEYEPEEWQKKILDRMQNTGQRLITILDRMHNTGQLLVTILHRRTTECYTESGRILDRNIAGYRKE
jgi:hypothetical protein